MKFEETLNILEKSEVFKDWKKSHKDAYLCSIFLIGKIENIGNEPLQFDYYFKDKITSFVIEPFEKSLGKNVKIGNEESIFKKEGEIDKLEINKIKISFDQALEIVNKFGKDKYPNEMFNKAIIILQKIMWNITFLTQSFNVFNVKIDTNNGNIIEEKLIPIFNFVNK